MSDFDRDLYVFAAGAAEMREYLAKFLEHRGEHSAATSLRLNWNPAWGDDLKGTTSTPVVEIVDPNGNVSYRRPLGDPLIAEARRTSGYSVRMVADVLVPPTRDETPIRQYERDQSMRPVMEQIQQDMASGVMSLLNTPPDLPVPPCRVCGKSEDILIYDREKLGQNICPACCGKAEHPDGETGHQFTERDIDGPYCTYCGLRRECVEWHADDE